MACLTDHTSHAHTAKTMTHIAHVLGIAKPPKLCVLGSIPRWAATWKNHVFDFLRLVCYPTGLRSKRSMLSMSPFDAMGDDS